ncbi:Shedu anti-phage system protein SduA domain-containing protein [Streptomyces physcomitrii]|uniref:Shedu anti-phage system protein SduA domain-containing protein n=1 Tax=Streptomyces physcomitrii TaxID=2724184 RepID=UPI0034102514
MKIVDSDDTEEEQEISESNGDDWLGIELLDGRLRLVSVQSDGSVKIFDTPGHLHGLLYVASLEAAGWKTLVQELEDLINSPKSAERDLHQFFERNPDFLCGDAYEEAQSHIVLQRDSDGPLIPDFALKPRNPNALCDLLELKLPRAKLLRVSKNRVRLTSAIMGASAQLREYQSYFDDIKKRIAIEETYGLRFFRPRMMVLIGKRSDYSASDLRSAESDVPNLSIVTYDDILERAKARLRRR